MGDHAVPDDWWDGFFDHDYEQLFGDAISDDETERAVNDLIALVGIRPGWRVLDAPGGAGRHAVPLSLLGCHCTVVDRAPSLLARARSVATTLDLDLKVVAADLRQPLDLGPPGGAAPHGPPFDLVANLFNSFGYFADPAEDDVLLDSLVAHLAPGGQVVLEVANPVAARAEPEHETARLAAATVRSHRRWDPELGRLAITYRVEPDDGGPVHTTGTVQRLHEADELVAMLGRRGLAVDLVAGDLDGRPLTDDTDWLVLRAHLPTPH